MLVKAYVTFTIVLLLALLWSIWKTARQMYRFLQYRS